MMSTKTTNKKKVSIIIIFFQPTRDSIKNACILSTEFNVIVVDNSPEKIIFSFNGLYIPLYKNAGIGGAQNIGLYEAFKQDSDYILFLDQDSCIGSKDIHGLINVFESVEKKDSHIVAIGAYPINASKGKPYKTNLKDDEDIKEVGAIISSGSLIKKSAFNVIGLLDANLFIDYVDFEWCWRAKHKGYNIYLTRSIELRHRVGDKSINFLGLSFIKSSYLRYYYQYRNFLWLSKRSYVPEGWKVKTFVHCLIEPLLVFFHPAYRGVRLRVMKRIFRGIVDGIKSQKNISVS